MSHGAPRVACIIPTRNGGADLIRLLHSLAEQTQHVDRLVVDSASTDGSAETAERLGCHVTRIEQRAFNHGGTRQTMIDRFPEYDVYVFMTQDAYLEREDALTKLIAPLTDPSVGAVCGRQLPHHDASPLAQHARAFSYPAESSRRTIQDAPRLGLRTAFLSNSFAAYRAQALREVGGFPPDVIFAEDMYVAAKMLLAGWSIAYAADAECRHSHSYTVSEEFRRYFDMGVFHARDPWIRQRLGGAGGEGLRYVRSELAFLGARRLDLWPESLLRNALKLLAYKLGQNERHLPHSLKRRMSSFKTYWDKTR